MAGKHFKGEIYEILTEAKHSETQEELIVYRNLETGEILVRPKATAGEIWVCQKAMSGDGHPRSITRLEKVLCDKKAMSDLLIKENCPHHFGLEDYETAGNHGCMGVKCEDCWNERAEEYDKT